MLFPLFTKEGQVVGYIQTPSDERQPRVVVKDGKCYVADAQRYEQYVECTWLNEPPFVPPEPKS